MHKSPIKIAQAPNSIRIILATNTLLLMVLFGSYRIDAVYGALKAAQLSDIVASGVYLLLFGSTLFAIGLWVRELRRNLGRNPTSQASGQTLKVDAILLLLWSAAFGGICLYGFMLGLMG